MKKRPRCKSKIHTIKELLRKQTGYFKWLLKEKRKAFRIEIYSFTFNID
jgi:hypothetical protein